jgi:hypothetical protein
VILSKPPFENWESEFLQMAMYVVLTVFLFQKGSSESKPMGKTAPQDADPRDAALKGSTPWPVKRGGLVGASVYLREKGSPESKPVAEPHYETGA